MAWTDSNRPIACQSALPKSRLIRRALPVLNRRQFSLVMAGWVTSVGLLRAAEAQKFGLKYLVGSSIYGETALTEILPEMKALGSTAIDIWPRVHGNQREQLDEMGEEAFSALLKKYGITLGCITQYKLGPFQLQKEMQLAQRLGCKTIVTGASGPKGLKGSELKAAVGVFAEQMKPHLEVAEQTGVVIAIENHANGLLETADSVKWLAELTPSRHLGIALAPYHLPQNADELASLITALGDRLEVFYAWQHGHGSSKAQDKDLELQQLPGRGPLDFKPLLQALKTIHFKGWTEIFMHPFPRGIAAMPTTAETTQVLNQSREYLEKILATL